MANTIIHKNSSVAAKVPLVGDLALGELAINTTDGLIYLKNGAGSVLRVGQDLSSVNGDILPDSDNVHSLGSATHMWKDVFIGPGSLYVNGQKIIEEDAGTIILHADADQNVQIRSDGSGDIEFLPSGSGNIDMKGSLSLQAGKNLLSGDGNPISCTVGFTLNGEQIKDMADPTLAGDAATKSYVDGIVPQALGTTDNVTFNTVTVNGSLNSDDITAATMTASGNVVVQGDLTVNGTTTTVNSTTVDVTDLNMTVASASTNDAEANGAGITFGGHASAGVMAYSSGTDRVIFSDLDGVTASNFYGALTGNVTGNVTGTASNAALLDSIDSSSFLRSDTADTHSATITPNANNTINMGSGALRYNTVYATTFDGTSTTAQYADLAEYYEGDQAMEKGRVVSFGGDKEVTMCYTDADTRVAGVVSSDPAFVMNTGLAEEKTSVCVALRGRVPCYMSGSVFKGDLMVADGNGGARAEANPAPGTILGKALGDSEGDSLGEIVVG